MNPYPGPYYVEQDGCEPYIVANGLGRIATMECPDGPGRKGTARDAATARLFASAPDLLAEAKVLRCLATSPRFQSMTVADALAELERNGAGHDGGRAIAKATGR